MGVALPLPRRGGGISPHMKALLHWFLKSSPQGLCPQGHPLGLNALCLRGGMGATQAPISEPHPLQNREAFMPKRASFGMQHPMLPGGVGRAAPQKLMCIAESETGRIKRDGAGKRVPTPLCWIFDCFSSAGNGLARGYVRRVRQRLPVHPDNAVPPRCRHRKVHRNRSNRPLLRPAPE